MTSLSLRIPPRDLKGRAMNTEIIKLSSDAVEFGRLTASDRDSIAKCAEVIKRGGLVVFPTETVYGLGGDATNPKSAEAIYAAKGRPSDNPLIIHISTPDEAEKYAATCELYYKLAERFMPGPLTVILPSKDSVPHKTRGGLSTVAVRCPSNKIASLLIKLSGVAIAAPSANLSGSPSPTTPGHAIDDMMGRVDMIIEGGECDFGLESTIVKIEDDGTLCLLRPGRITVEELLEVAPVEVADAVTSSLREGEVALSPGMKYRHYAPKAPLVLLDGELSDCIRFVSASGEPRAAIMCYTEDIPKASVALPDVAVYDLGGRGEYAVIAHRLFSLLRDADKHSHKIIYAPLPEKGGVSLAIYNRLIRAAAHTIINLRG